MSRYLNLRIFVGGAPSDEQVADYVRGVVLRKFAKKPPRAQELTEPEEMSANIDDVLPLGDVTGPCDDCGELVVIEWERVRPGLCTGCVVRRLRRQQCEEEDE